MQTPWQMLWPGFRPVWQFPLLREHIRLPSLWTTGIATDYSASNHLRRLLLVCDLVAWVCTFKVFTMIAFRALGWRQTATLWWRTRETTAWRSTSISSRPSSAPVDGHLLVYQAFELVLGPLRSRCSWSPQWTATILASQSTVEIGVAPPCPPRTLSKSFSHRELWRQFEGKSQRSSNIPSRSSLSTNIASQDVFI